MTRKEIYDRIDELEKVRAWEHGHEITDEILRLYRLIRNGPNPNKADLAGGEPPDTSDAEALYADYEKEEQEKEYMKTAMASGTLSGGYSPPKINPRHHEEPYTSNVDNTPLLIAMATPFIVNNIMNS